MAVILTAHSVERYQQRVKPALGLGRCRRELLALATAAPFQTENPMGTELPADAELERGPEPDGYLVLAPGIYGIVMLDEEQRRHLLTVVVHRGVSDHRRQRRNDAKKAMRRRKAAIRRGYIFKEGERRHRVERWA